VLKKGETVKGEPLMSINTPSECIELPSAEEQHEGFYSESATKICQLFPTLYKTVKPKGVK
jgi:hypothetical protein